MNDLKTQFLYGLVILFSLYLFAVILWPLREVRTDIFYSIISVFTVFASMFASMRFFEKVSKKYHETALQLGFVWFFTCFAGGAVLFSIGPTYLSFFEYATTFGILHIILLIVPNGLGCLGKKIEKQRNNC